MNEVSRRKLVTDLDEVGQHGVATPSSEGTMPERNQLSILLVEDDPVSARLIEQLLRNNFALPVTVVCATLLSDALQHLINAKFDMILTDLGLPDSQGLETFREISRQAGETPIVVISADDDSQLAVTAVSQGAQDYVVKGHGYAVTLSRSVQFALERKRRLEAEREIILAQKVQQRWLPKKGPNLVGFEFGAAMYPAAETSGDYYDFIVPLPALGPQAIGLAVGDVSGHGLGPSLVMGEVRMCLRAFSLLVPDIAQILTYTNRMLVESNTGHFVTMFFGHLDHATRTLYYASAGHRGYLLRQDGRIQILESTGLVLGVRSEIAIAAAAPLQLESGDIIAVFTDGIQETMSRSNEMYGQQRILDYLQAHREEQANQIVVGLCEAARHFSEGGLQQDDVTGMVVKVE